MVTTLKFSSKIVVNGRETREVAESILEINSEGNTEGGSIVLNATAEFCHTLGDIPAYGLAGNRDEDAQELLDFEREMIEEKKHQEEGKHGAWNEVEIEMMKSLGIASATVVRTQTSKKRRATNLMLNSTTQIMMDT
ncbi:U4/U6.U5 tri-snRNP-associated protein 1-like [Cryptotermes secundus]|uniref:U4/U6.U5 tri-snRNP-associated protein 1-like n=1 Tax=Cryptotermes secundus TaxID=105785 RepID=UPI000CD7D826|nr:U4/U6.U5 tri-snRNP-associated protein 1-like [Cryptotermes secundus]XP_023719960.1 U4/U6.U5 tri-snRNP-associated protein 1-like [Cryptotermes secundus]XP_023719961.1 U4/U6.U5 tri-snRNP-associated protein 1-like [Cryptotermes secundus]